eukprot:2626179-Prymnesium_polylepis.1
MVLAAVRAAWVACALPWTRRAACVARAAVGAGWLTQCGVVGRAGAGAGAWLTLITLVLVVSLAVGLVAARRLGARTTARLAAAKPRVLLGPAGVDELQAARAGVGEVLAPAVEVRLQHVDGERRQLDGAVGPAGAQ